MTYVEKMALKIWDHYTSPESEKIVEQIIADTKRACKKNCVKYFKERELGDMIEIDVDYLFVHIKNAINQAVVKEDKDE